MARPLRALLLLILLALCVQCTPALAHGDQQKRFPPDRLHGRARAAEQHLRVLESATLGVGHAAEHALDRVDERRAAAHWRRLSPASRRAIRHRDERARAAASQAGLEDPPDLVGRWTTTPFALPNYAIHAAMLPTGKVAFWGYPPPDENNYKVNSGQAAIWDPSKGTGQNAFTEVPPPLMDPDGPGPQGMVPAPLYCAGLSFQADGSLVVAGGNLLWYQYDQNDAYTNYAGLNTVFTFDPWSQTWTRQQDMAHGRWYPGQAELYDGRTFILGGYTEEPPGAKDTTIAEIYDPKADPSRRVFQVTSADRQTATYPHMFTLPNRNLLLAGPAQGDSAILDTHSYTWSQLPSPSQNRVGGNAVLIGGDAAGDWQVMQVGGYDLNLDPGNTGNVPATNTTETIDARSASPQWAPDAPLNVARANQNTVVLPDGSMVAVGGGIGRSAEEGSYAVQPDDLRVELFDPATHSWRLGPAEAEYRAYHSTALLLPDGRVWSAGDDKHPTRDDGGFSRSDTAEIYSPPYLYKGKRPSIRRAPKQLRYGDRFGVWASKDARRLVLMAPSATTHADDMGQRRVVLHVTDRIRKKGLNAFAPVGPGVAPPGYYMLFALNRAGVPSTARWVRLGTDAKKQPELKKVRRHRHKRHGGHKRQRLARAKTRAGFSRAQGRKQH